MLIAGIEGIYSMSETKKLEKDLAGTIVDRLIFGGPLTVRDGAGDMEQAEAIVRTVLYDHFAAHVKLFHQLRDDPRQAPHIKGIAVAALAALTGEGRS